MSKEFKARPRFKHQLTRSLYFRTSSPSRVPDRQALETASERARSPTPMFRKT
uniref:Uncharacterized protein n=1 Tax=Anguilla anguilla TaxID=7936 RepID=A0A0E9PLD9_ANGAN